MLVVVGLLVIFRISRFDEEDNVQEKWQLLSLDGETKKKDWTLPAIPEDDTLENGQLPSLDTETLTKGAAFPAWLGGRVEG